jgi:hypothetical protein
VLLPLLRARDGEAEPGEEFPAAAVAVAVLPIVVAFAQVWVVIRGPAVVPLITKLSVSQGSVMTSARLRLPGDISSIWKVDEMFVDPPQSTPLEQVRVSPCAVQVVPGKPLKISQLGPVHVREKDMSFVRRQKLQVPLTEFMVQVVPREEGLN